MNLLHAQHTRHIERSRGVKAGRQEAWPDAPMRVHHTTLALDAEPSSRCDTTFPIRSTPWLLKRKPCRATTGPSRRFGRGNPSWPREILALYQTMACSHPQPAPFAQAEPGGNNEVVNSLHDRTHRPAKRPRPTPPTTTTTASAGGPASGGSARRVAPVPTPSAAALPLAASTSTTAATRCAPIHNPYAAAVAARKIMRPPVAGGGVSRSGSGDGKAGRETPSGNGEHPARGRPRSHGGGEARAAATAARGSAPEGTAGTRGFGGFLSSRDTEGDGLLRRQESGRSMGAVGIGGDEKGGEGRSLGVRGGEGERRSAWKDRALASMENRVGVSTGLAVGGAGTGGSSSATAAVTGRCVWGLRGRAVALSWSLGIVQPSSYHFVASGRSGGGWLTD